MNAYIPITRDIILARIRPIFVSPYISGNGGALLGTLLHILYSPMIEAIVNTIPITRNSITNIIFSIFFVLVLSENHAGVLKELKQLCTPRISLRNISTHNKIRMDSGCVLRNDRFVFCAESAGVNNTLSRVLSPGMFSF